MQESLRGRWNEGDDRIDRSCKSLYRYRNELDVRFDLRQFSMVLVKLSIIHPVDVVSLRSLHSIGLIAPHHSRADWMTRATVVLAILSLLVPSKMPFSPGAFGST
jgi:hypothetical protein